MSRNAPLGEAQPLAVHASQQLEWTPTHADPSFGALQWSALDFVEHFVVPFDVVRQQVTNPGLPQVDRAAHLVMVPLQLLFTSVVFTWSDTGAGASGRLLRAPGRRLCAAPLRKGGGLVDVSGRWLVGTKGKNRHCPPCLPWRTGGGPIARDVAVRV